VIDKQVTSNKRQKVWSIPQGLPCGCSLQNVPITFLTAVNKAGVEEHAFAMGAADYIMKPYDRENLSKRIKTILEKKN
jgi:DNA-binding response OmpR family regulator